MYHELRKRGTSHCLYSIIAALRISLRNRFEKVVNFSCIISSRTCRSAGVSDVVVFLAAGGTMMIVAVIAMAVPTRRAMRIDPLTALRAE